MPKSFLFSPHPPLWGEGQVPAHYWWGLGWRCQIGITPGSVHSFSVSLTPPWWSSAHPTGGGAPESSTCPFFSRSSVWPSRRSGLPYTQRGFYVAERWPLARRLSLSPPPPSPTPQSWRPGQGTQYLRLPLSFPSPINLSPSRRAS